MKEPAKRRKRLSRSTRISSPSEIRSSLRLVAKIHGENSKTVKETAAAQRAIDEEMAQIVDAGAIDPKKLLSWKRDVAGKIPGARKVKGMLVMVEKNIESQQLRRWKARFVAVGCRILDQFER